MVSQIHSCNAVCVTALFLLVNINANYMHDVNIVGELAITGRTELAQEVYRRVL